MNAYQNGPPRPARREKGEKGNGLEQLAGLVHDDDGDAAQPTLLVGEGGCCGLHMCVLFEFESGIVYIETWTSTM